MLTLALLLGPASAQNIAKGRPVTANKEPDDSTAPFSILTDGNYRSLSTSAMKMHTRTAPGSSTAVVTITLAKVVRIRTLDYIKMTEGISDTT